MKINIIVAMCNKTRGIGFQNKLPWNIKNDLKQFKILTIGNKNNAIVMGKNTWNSLPKKPLPDRKNIILSSTLQPMEKLNFNQIKKNNVSIFNNYKNLMFNLEKQSFNEVWIIGGEKIYNTFLENKLVDNIFITSIETYKPQSYDTYFPTIPNHYNLKHTSNCFTHSTIRGPELIKYVYNYKIYSK